MSVNRGLGIPSDQDEGQQIRAHAGGGHENDLAPRVREDLLYGDFGFFVFHRLLPLWG